MKEQSWEEYNSAENRALREVQYLKRQKEELNRQWIVGFIVGLFWGSLATSLIILMTRG